MDKIHNTDQRRFTRVPFDASVELSLASTLTTSPPLKLNGTLTDISFKGLMLRFEESLSLAKLAKESLATAKIILISSTIEFELNVRIKYIKQSSVGLHIEQMPIEAAEYLRTLMLHNLGDDALLQRELQALVSNVN